MFKVSTPAGGNKKRTEEKGGIVRVKVMDTSEVGSAKESEPKGNLCPAQRKDQEEGSCHRDGKRSNP